ncbi:MAG: TetR/AcrR family transcriptional regulator [Arthrobacter sp.]|jgi:AcrR family transcriptional regulator|nr:TetR/AcrR family transcriptional regulator [Arthrobacter sp.]
MSNELPARMEADARRAQIVSVASAHFAERGVAAASMSAIAREAGVTRALVYHYFAGKEALLGAVLEAEAHRLLVATQPAAHLSPAANVDRALDAYLDFFASSTGELRAFYAGHSPVEDAEALVEGNHERHLPWLIEASGRPDEPALRLALSGWLALVQTIAAGSVGHAALPRGEAKALCVRALEGLLGAPLSTASMAGPSAGGLSTGTPSEATPQASPAASTPSSQQGQA